MSGRSTPATVAADCAKVRYVLHEYTHDPAERNFGEEAARGIGADTSRVFKTLVVDADGKLALAMVPVARQLDLKAAATALHAKRAELADPAKAERATGYVVGGISPIGGKKSLPALLDESAFTFETVFVSAGRRGLQMELSPADLQALTTATPAPLAR